VRYSAPQTATKNATATSTEFISAEAYPRRRREVPAARQYTSEEKERRGPTAKANGAVGGARAAARQEPVARGGSVRVMKTVHSSNAANHASNSANPRFQAR